MGGHRGQNWEIIDQLFIYFSRILAITLVNILRETIILLALSHPRHDKNINNWAQRLNFNLSHWWVEVIDFHILRILYQERETCHLLVEPGEPWVLAANFLIAWFSGGRLAAWAIGPGPPRPSEQSPARGRRASSQAASQPGGCLFFRGSRVVWTSCWSGRCSVWRIPGVRPDLGSSFSWNKSTPHIHLHTHIYVQTQVCGLWLAYLTSVVQCGFILNVIKGWVWKESL